jgi:hypothetical protein
MRRRGVIAVLFALTLQAFSLCDPARAEPAGGRFELLGGIAWQETSGSAYLGGGWAFGKALSAPGPRIRAKAAFGAYTYDTLWSEDFGTIGIVGQFAMVEAMAGWQFRRGPATVKLFAGYAEQAHDLTPDDPRNQVDGIERGAAGAIETWFDLGPAVWAQFDAHAMAAFETYGVHGRLGWRVRPRLAVGAEAGAIGAVAYDAVKAGGFVKTWLMGTELTLSGGATGAYPLGDPAFYTELSFYRVF